MGDAFKCKNCGTVVETLQSCPSCGETAMQPIQSSGDTDVVSDIVESGTAAGETESAAPEATDSDQSSEPATGTDATSNGDAGETADSTGTETASEGNRERTGRDTDSSSGLLSWVKSLF